MQITASTETFNLKHTTIVLGISSYYTQKYVSGTPLKCQKRWGFRGLRPLTPTKGALPPGPPPGALPPDPPTNWNEMTPLHVSQKEQSKNDEVKYHLKQDKKVTSCKLGKAEFILKMQANANAPAHACFKFTVWLHNFLHWWLINLWPLEMHCGCILSMISV